MLKNWQLSRTEKIGGWDEFALSDPIREKKDELLEMAKKKLPKPMPNKHHLGYVLIEYLKRDNEFRQQIQSFNPDWVPKSPAEILKDHVLAAERLAKENDGCLPITSWLIKNGYKNLYEATKRFPEAFKHIQFADRTFKLPAEWVPIAENLARENDGILPYSFWLIQNGYNGLYQQLKKNPHLFGHIPQEQKVKRPEEWVPIAEQLAKDNNGVLPHGKKLIKTGFGGLLSCMKIHPELFKHFKQIKACPGRNDGEGEKWAKEKWLPIAEQLAKDNNNILPHTKKLRNLRYSGLAYSIKKYPNAFSHIVQHRVHKTTAEYVKIAEELAKDNGGFLPPNSKLKSQFSRLIAVMQKEPERFKHINKINNNGTSAAEWVVIAEALALESGGILPCKNDLRKTHSGLVDALYRHPKLFSHIAISSKGGRKPEEYIKTAEDLAKEHDGILPNPRWLEINGHTAMAYAIYRHPELFKHIPQEKKARRPEEWALVAEQLAKEHNGVLPSRGWLLDNGYSAIACAIYRHPELFKHIKIKGKRIA